MPSLQLTLNPKNSTWSLHSPKKDSPYLDGVKMRLRYQTKPSAWYAVRKKSHQTLEIWKEPQITEAEDVPSPHGNLRQSTLTPAPERCGLQTTLTFALTEEHPLLLWKISLENKGDAPIWIDRIDMLRAGFFPQKSFLPEPGPITLRKNIIPDKQGVIRPHPSPGKLAFFSNGWQSWSRTGSYGASDHYRQTRLGFLASPMWYNAGTPRPNKLGYFVSDMFGVMGNRQHRTGILAGFLSQKEHFGSLKARIDEPLYPALRLWANGDHARLDPGASMTTDWAVIQFVDIDAPDPLKPYLEAVAREHGLQSPVSSLQSSVGWCSWYDYYQNVTAEDVRANLQTAQKIKDTVPLELIQIDDGFEKEIGDWLTFDPGFPDGVKPLADEIKQAGFTPGLWLAPFIVHPKSALARKHRKWILHNRWRLPVNAGFVWNTFTRALDITYPPALEHAKKVLRTAVEDWGFTYLKLDFLYAAALPGKYHDPTKTRAQVLRQGLEALREAVGDDVTLLGCGAPLGSAIGLVDAMRIGADVDPSWYPSFGGFKAVFHAEPNMPSVRNALQNTITRANLHNRWWVNDPDCLLLRPDTKLTLAEVRSLAAGIAFSGGLTLLSDNLSAISAERLQIAQTILPPIGQRPRVLDWFDAATPSLLRLDLENATGKWHLLAIFNWDWRDKVLDLGMERLVLDAGQTFYVNPFWSGETAHILGERLTLDALPPHGVKVVALRPIAPETPQYVGSDLHISQGMEVAQWTATTSALRVRLERPGHAQGQIVLSLPAPPQKVFLNKKEIPWQKAEGNLYRFAVQFQKAGELELGF
ncbi:MAG: alpha-galactosidase [Chloroflexota bacterium]|nr:alpha-galactosidase [Chloroflexota bacterium]